MSAIVSITYDLNAQTFARDDTGEVIPVACAAFVLCDREATRMLPNHILGEVPSCQRCFDRLTD